MFGGFLGDPGFGGPGFGDPGFGGPGFGGPRSDKGGFGGGRGGHGFGPGGRHGLKRAAFVSAAMLLDGPADAAQIMQRVSEATGARSPRRRTWRSSRSGCWPGGAWSPSTTAWPP